MAPHTPQALGVRCTLGVSCTVDVRCAGRLHVGAAPRRPEPGSPEIQWSMKRARQRSSGSEQASRLPKMR